MGGLNSTGGDWIGVGVWHVNEGGGAMGVVEFQELLMSIRGLEWMVEMRIKLHL